MAIDALDRTFVDASVRRLRQYQTRIEACLQRLNEEQIWTRGADSGNAIGNLVAHLCGNVRQWIVSGIGGEPDHRDRDLEFTARGGGTRSELTEALAAVLDAAEAVIQQLDERRLAERVSIQGYDVTVLEAVYHVVEHFSHHTGQIIFATKLITREDLGFYAHLKRAHAEKTP